MHKKIKVLQICAIDRTAKGLLLPLIKKLTDNNYDVQIACTCLKQFRDIRKKKI